MALPMTGSTPLVSILLPAHNAAETLEACLGSVVRQTLTNWECVLVDDGSTDGTPVLARRRAEADCRIRTIRRSRGGLVAALNAGLRQCRGDYVARMDADDLMHRHRLQEQADLLESRRDLVGAGCHVRLFPRASLGPGMRQYENWLNTIDSPAEVDRNAYVECPLAHPTLMMRSDRMHELGYRDKGWPEDYDLILRILSGGERLGVLPDRRLSWRRSPTALSRTDPAYEVERFTECKAHFLARTFLAGGDRYILWGYGGTGRSLSRALRELGKTPSQIVELHPGRLGNRIRGTPVISPDELATVARKPLVVSVAGAVPRTRIREFLTATGWKELRDFVCAA